MDVAHRLSLRAAADRLVQSEACDSALVEYYGLPESARRIHSSLTLLSGAAQELSPETGAQLQAHFPKLTIIDSPSELAGLGMDEARQWLLARKFLEDGSRPGVLRMGTKAFDPEVGVRLGLGTFNEIVGMGSDDFSNVITPPFLGRIDEGLLSAADPQRLELVERYIQRVRLDYNSKGQLERVFLDTYFWPPAGLPGVNLEHLSWEVQKDVSRRLITNETYASSVALSTHIGLAMTGAHWRKTHG